MSLVVAVRLRSKTHFLSLLGAPSDAAGGAFGLRSLVFRTCLYPAATFLTFVGTNVATGYFFLHGWTPSVLFYWAWWGYSARGILHLLAFVVEPTVCCFLAQLFDGFGGRVRPDPPCALPCDDSADGMSCFVKRRLVMDLWRFT